MELAPGEANARRRSHIGPLRCPSCDRPLVLAMCCDDCGALMECSRYRHRARCQACRVKRKAVTDHAHHLRSRGDGIRRCTVCRSPDHQRSKCPKRGPPTKPIVYTEPVGPVRGGLLIAGYVS